MTHYRSVHRGFLGLGLIAILYNQVVLLEALGLAGRVEFVVWLGVLSILAWTFYGEVVYALKNARAHFRGGAEEAEA